LLGLGDELVRLRPGRGEELLGLFSRGGDELVCFDDGSTL
jgi:hypothetical protein